MNKRIGLILLAVLVFFLVFRDFFIKLGIESIGSSVVGAPLKVGSFSLSLLSSQVHMKDFRIYNPAGFSNNLLIDIAHIDVHFDLSAIISGKLYFSLIDLDIRKLAIERNQQSVFNVASLKIKPQPSSEPLIMKIDVLKLNVDQVTLRDATKGDQVKEISHGVGLHKKTFKNITSPQQLVALVLFESSGLGPLKDMGMAMTKEVLSDVKDVAGQVTGTATKTVGSIFGSLKSIVHK